MPIFIPDFCYANYIETIRRKKCHHTHVSIDALCSVQSVFFLSYNANHTWFHFKAFEEVFLSTINVNEMCFFFSFFPTLSNWDLLHEHTNAHILEYFELFSIEHVDFQLIFRIKHLKGMKRRGIEKKTFWIALNFNCNPI